VLFVGGRSGTLGEFCIAYDEGKLIGILLNSGGISNDFLHIASLVHKETGSIIISDDNPELLVDRCLEKYRTEPIPSSQAFDRNTKSVMPPPRPRLRIVQESGG
jgi:hypothetical protein